MDNINDLLLVDAVQLPEGCEQFLFERAFNKERTLAVYPFTRAFAEQKPVGRAVKNLNQLYQ